MGYLLFLKDWIFELFSKIPLTGDALSKAFFILSGVFVTMLLIKQVFYFFGKGKVLVVLGCILSIYLYSSKTFPFDSSLSSKFSTEAFEKLVEDVKTRLHLQ